MKKKTKRKPVILDPPKDLEEYGERFIRLGEALQDENTTLRDLTELSSSVGLLLRLSITPKSKDRQIAELAKLKTKVGERP